MADEEIARLRATRGAHRAVVTKIIDESEAILEHNEETQLDAKTKSRLHRIEKMLNEKMQLLSEFDEKILAGCKVEEIEKEVDEAEFLKMKVMDAIANISISTTPPVSTTIITNASRLQFLTLHQHLLLSTTTPHYQDHDHPDQDYRRSHWPNSKEMLRNSEVSGILSKALST